MRKRVAALQKELLRRHEVGLCCGVCNCCSSCCRYAGEHIATSLTLPLRKRPGAALGVRLCQYLRPKIHPLLLDATINSPHTVRLNIYQVRLGWCLVGCLPWLAGGGCCPNAASAGAPVVLPACAACSGSQAWRCRTAPSCPATACCPPCGCLDACRPSCWVP